MRKISYEYTDTYGGEANYSWVKRGQIEVKNGTSDLAIVRRVKRELGLNGVKCDREEWGEAILLKPRGYCRVLFIN